MSCNRGVGSIGALFVIIFCEVLRSLGFIAAIQRRVIKNTNYFYDSLNCFRFDCEIVYVLTSLLFIYVSNFCMIWSWFGHVLLIEIKFYFVSCNFR